MGRHTGGRAEAPATKVVTDMRSRKVAGYVNAARRARRLRQRLDAKLDAIAPLRVKTERAEAEVAGRRGDLTGTQYAEAQRLLGDMPPTKTEIAKKVAAELGLPVVDLPLSSPRTERTAHSAPEAP